MDERGHDDPADDDTPASYPIGGTALVKAAALASVPAQRLPTLLATVQRDLGPRIDRYRRRYERIGAERDRAVFLVEPDHWNDIGDRLDFSDRERDAVRRAHEAAVERSGTDAGRRAEFEAALEIRTAVVIGVPVDTASEESKSGAEDSPNSQRDR